MALTHHSDAPSPQNPIASLTLLANQPKAVVAFSTQIHLLHPMIPPKLLPILALLSWGSSLVLSAESVINRQSVVQRHDVQVNTFHPLDSLSVGNGGFAFTVDPTGLQSFPELFNDGVSLGTQSDWGWNHAPNTEAFTREETLRHYRVGDRAVPYAVQSHDTERQQAAMQFFRQNPHRLHLGLLGWHFTLADGSSATFDAIKGIDQRLKLWKGEIHSHFELEGIPVQVITLADPDSDGIAVRMQSELLRQPSRVKLRLRLPYPTFAHTDSAVDLNPTTHDQHVSKLTVDEPHSKGWEHRLDSAHYRIVMQLNQPATVETVGPHEFIIHPHSSGESIIEFTFHFEDLSQTDAAPADLITTRDFSTIQSENERSWQNFWTSGGFVEFTGSTDVRAHELERRMILSRYLTRIQCVGMDPPQETGLTFNSWHGKFHLEMHWWHSVHWALWGQPEYLEQTLETYDRILDVARAKASLQGYQGARWPKMTDPTGADSPSDIGEFLIWQQPHFIYFAELLYRLQPDETTLNRFAERIWETADFMADFAVLDPTTGIASLPPPLIPAQERLPAESTFDPAFEVRYWKWALNIAQQWRARLGLEQDSDYQRIIDGLPPLVEQDGRYLAAASAPDSYSNPLFMQDHPMVLGAIGMLPWDASIDPHIARATFDFIDANWDWPSTWGWDYPMMAMAATRLGLPEKAVDALLMDVQKNTYLRNGHNYQDERLRIYLPGNGGLLTAIAMMAAGFEGTDTERPGFPSHGWSVRAEGLHAMP